VKTRGYVTLEKSITTKDLGGVEGRWTCGCWLLKERDGKGRLPNGRLEQLSKTLGKSRAELQNRMKFAERYPTKAKVKAAFVKYESWSRICQEGLYASTSEAEGLAERGALDLADLAGLSDAEREMVVAEVQRFYDTHCHDEAHDKDPGGSGRIGVPPEPRTAITINPAGIRRLAHRAIVKWRKLKGWKPRDPDPDQNMSALERENVEGLNQLKMMAARQRLTAAQFRSWLWAGPFACLRKYALGPRVEVEAATELAQEAATDTDVPVQQPSAPITPLDTYRALAQRFMGETRTLLTEPHGLLEERVVLDADEAKELLELVHGVRQALDDLEEHAGNFSLTSMAS